MSMWISVICMLMGSMFILIAAIGLLRMPDLIMRMHAATKAGTLGAGLILISVIFHFQRWSVTMESLLTIFLFLLLHLLHRIYWQGLPIFGGLNSPNLQLLMN